MISKECPFSDKIKLKLILDGKPEVCVGARVKGQAGEYKVQKYCETCNFYDSSYFAILAMGFNPWQQPPPPNPITTVTTATLTTTADPEEVGWMYYQV